MADEEFDGTDMVFNLLGEGQRGAPETRKALPQGVVEPCDVIDFPGLLRHRFVPLRGEHPCGHCIRSWLELGVWLLHCRETRPPHLRAVATASPDVQGNELSALSVHGQPAPLLRGLLLDTTPRRICFRFELMSPHVAWIAGKLYMQGSRACRKALSHEVQPPGEPDTHGTTEPAQRDALTEEGRNQDTLLVRNDGGIGARTELALTCFARMLLFAMAGMAIFLVPL